MDLDKIKITKRYRARLKRNCLIIKCLIWLCYNELYIYLLAEPATLVWWWSYFKTHTFLICAVPVHKTPNASLLQLARLTKFMKEQMWKYTKYGLTAIWFDCKQREKFQTYVKQWQNLIYQYCALLEPMLKGPNQTKRLKLSLCL